MATIVEGRAASVATNTGIRSGILPPLSRDETLETNGTNNNSNNNNIYVHVSFNLCL